MGGPTSSTTSEIYMQAYERTAITTALLPPKVWGLFADDVCSILKHAHLKTFSIILTIFIKILSLIWRNKIMKSQHFLTPYRNRQRQRKGFSTQYVLLSLIERWRLCLDKQGFAGALLMDLSRAFDIINHKLLIDKLHAYGFSIEAPEVLLSYL